jgi:hypothetical protein
LHQAGTGDEYPGLYRDVKDFRRPSSETLARIPDRLPESTPIPPLVDAMLAMDALLDGLKARDARGWPQNPESGEATLLLEQYREISRLMISADRSPKFRKDLAMAREHAIGAAAILDTPASDSAKKHDQVQRLAADCAACHRAHRN